MSHYVVKGFMPANNGIIASLTELLSQSYNAGKCHCNNP